MFLSGLSTCRKVSRQRESADKFDAITDSSLKDYCVLTNPVPLDIPLDKKAVREIIEMEAEG